MAGETVKISTVPATDDGSENAVNSFGNDPPGASVGDQASASTAIGGEVRAMAG